MMEWMPLPVTTNERLAQILEALLGLPVLDARTIRDHLARPGYALDADGLDDLTAKLTAVLLVPTGRRDAMSWVKAHRDRTRSVAPNGKPVPA
jgi:hypothetical protein